MSPAKAYISAALREHVSRQARYRYGYCLRSEELMGMPVTLDHIIPEAAGVPTSEENLWLACRLCNEFKGMQTHAPDPQTAEQVHLYNPASKHGKSTLPGARMAPPSLGALLVSEQLLLHCN